MSIFNDNVILRSLKFVVWDVFMEIVRMPVWWYTGGLMRVARSLLESFREVERRESLTVWAKHLFVPMYGMNDWQSRAVSFFVRVVMLFWKLFVVLVWSSILLVLLLAWFAIPPVVVWGILYNS